MESQREVPKVTQVKLFGVTLATTLAAIISPFALTIAFDDSTVLGIVVSVIFAFGITLGVRKILRLSSTPGAKLFERSSHALMTLALTGGLLLAMTGSYVATIGQHQHLHSFSRTEDGTEVISGEVATYTHGAWGWVGLGLLITAVLLVFVALAFIPSTERELRRRIDLEASSVALGTSLLFFFLYSGVAFVVPLPQFSANVAIVTMIVAYLAARLALSIRYR
jgi:hypothetical protein